MSFLHHTAWRMLNYIFRRHAAISTKNINSLALLFPFKMHYTAHKYFFLSLLRVQYPLQTQSGRSVITSMAITLHLVFNCYFGSKDIDLSDSDGALTTHASNNVRTLFYYASQIQPLHQRIRNRYQGSECGENTTNSRAFKTISK